jgi:hypothetical protein
MSQMGPGCVKTLKLKFQIESSSRLRQFEKQKPLAETVGRRQLRKQFCVLNARGRFYTAWVIQRHAELSGRCLLCLQQPTTGCAGATQLSARRALVDLQGQG